MLTSRHAQVSTLADVRRRHRRRRAFGFIGLVIGPVLISLVVALVRFSRTNTAAGA